MLAGNPVNRRLSRRPSDQHWPQGLLSSPLTMSGTPPCRRPERFLNLGRHRIEARAD